MSDILTLLHTRRSVSAKDMDEPGPDKGQLEDMLKAAARVPDHGKTFPFYFVVFEGEARARIGQAVAERFRTLNPDAPEEKVESEAGRFLRAPCVVGVVHRKRRGKHPLWEQIMSVGAACQNLILAAHGHGFAAQWLSEWHSYDEEIRELIGLDERDTLAGYIHIGSAGETPSERDRPDLQEIMTSWEPGCRLRKGDVYDREKMDFPRLGF